MEATKSSANEMINKSKLGKPKLISVKSIVNIRIELEQQNALMLVADSPLCKVILHPMAHAKSLMDPAHPTKEVGTRAQFQKYRPLPHINRVRNFISADTRQYS